MATYSNILAWESPWTEEPGRLQSMGSQRVRQDLATKRQTTTGTEEQKSSFSPMLKHYLIFRPLEKHKINIKAVTVLQVFI